LNKSAKIKGKYRMISGFGTKGDFDLKATAPAGDPDETVSGSGVQHCGLRALAGKVESATSAAARAKALNSGTCSGIAALRAKRWFLRLRHC